MTILLRFKAFQDTCLYSAALHTVQRNLHGFLRSTKAKSTKTTITVSQILDVKQLYTHCHVIFVKVDLLYFHCYNKQVLTNLLITLTLSQIY